MKLFKASTIIFLLAPFTALAQRAPVYSSMPDGLPVLGEIPVPGEDRVSQILELFSYWLVVIATIIIAIGLITFLWGVVQYITAGADEEKRATARYVMLYGVIGLFVMVSVWGLVYFLADIVGVDPGSGVELPGIPAVVVDQDFGGGGTPTDDPFGSFRPH